jgi:hypothetical protein
MCLLGDPDENNLLYTVESVNRLTDQNGRPPERVATSNITVDDMQVIPNGQTSAPGRVTAHDKPVPVSQAIAPDRSEGWSIAFAILFLLTLCALVIGMWDFFLH